MYAYSAYNPVCLCSLFVCHLQKNDFCDFSNKKKPCDLVQSIIYGPGTPNPDDGVEGAGTFTQYRKEYNSATGKVTKVVAGIFELRFYDTLSMLLHYNGSSIYFTDEHHAGDTVLTARFDAANRLQKIETSGDAADHNFYSVAFTYGTKRLASYTIEPFKPIRLTYDANGNVVRMYANETQDTEGTFFTYDLSVQATRQWYTDYFISGSENALYLAQFMGWLPDLEPVNKRTYYKIVLDDDDPDDDEPPYVLSSAELADHVYDSDGELVSYKSGSETYTNLWNCGAKKYGAN